MKLYERAVTTEVDVVMKGPVPLFSVLRRCA